MSMTNTKNNDVEVLGPGRRRRWTASEKLAMVRETYEPGMSVSLVTRRRGVNPNQLFQHPSDFGSHPRNCLLENRNHPYGCLKNTLEPQFPPQK